jgi:hypothetical protein
MLKCSRLRPARQSDARLLGEPWHPFIAPRFCTENLDGVAFLLSGVYSVVSVVLCYTVFNAISGLASQ